MKRIRQLLHLALGKKTLPDDNSTGYIVNASIKLLSLHGFSLLVGFFLNYFLARNVHLSDYGSYVYIFNFFYLLNTFCLFGLDTLSVKMAPIYASEHKHTKLKGLLLFSIFVVSLFSLIVASIFFLTTNSLANFKLANVDNWIIICIVSLLAPSITLINQAFLQGLKKNLLRQAGEKVVKPLVILIIIVFISFQRRPSLEDLIWINIGVSGFIAFGTFLVLKANIGFKLNEVAGEYDIEQWRKNTVLFFLLSILFVVNSRIDILLLGFLRSSGEVGIYNVVLKISELTGVGLLTVNFIISPLIAGLVEKKNFHQLQQLITRSASTALVISLPFFFTIIYFRHELLLFFGVSFIDGENALVILVIGQVVNVLFGSVGLLLLMSGNQKYSIFSVSIGIIVNAALNLVLTPKYGLIGTAISTSIVIFTWNFCMYLFVRKLIKIRTTAFRII